MERTAFVSGTSMVVHCLQLGSIRQRVQTEADHRPFYLESPHKDEGESPSNNGTTCSQTWLSLSGEGLGAEQTIG